jgi:hypothetical protein
MIGVIQHRITDMPPRRPPDLPAGLMRFRVVNGGRA